MFVAWKIKFADRPDKMIFLSLDSVCNKMHGAFFLRFFMPYVDALKKGIPIKRGNHLWVGVCESVAVMAAAISKP